MATYIVGGPVGIRTWGGRIDPDGHRTWNVTFLTAGSSRDGPANHAQTPGLPYPGAFWVAKDDVDVYAWFRAGPRTIQQIGPGSVPYHGSDANDVSFFEQTFEASTRPPDASGPGGGGGRDDAGSRKRCADQRIEDPLAEPPSTSGSSVRFQQEEEFSANGTPFTYTSFEKVLGQHREFDAHREQVTVEQNVLNLNRAQVRACMNKLNDAALWDMPSRCWKLTDWSWQRKLYGTCNFYYTRRLVFESWADEIPSGHEITVPGHPLRPYLKTGPDGRTWLPGWDRYVLDESNKVLSGKWHWVSGSWIDVNINGSPPDPDTPGHYISAKDRFSQPTRMVLSRTSHGRPATGADDANYIRLKRYRETNLLVLGIPVTL